MNAKRLINSLFETEQVSFEHELNLGELKAVVYVTAYVSQGGSEGYEHFGFRGSQGGGPEISGMEYSIIGVADVDNNEVEVTPEIQKQVDAAFEAASEELTDQAFHHNAP